MDFCMGKDVSDNVDTTNNILNIIPDDHDYFSWQDMVFDAIPCDTYDGDTTGFCWIYNGKVYKCKCRCIGYDSPEMRCGTNDPERDAKKALGLKAKERFIEILNQDPFVTIHCSFYDKYGRVLVTMYNATNGNKSINDIMIEEGHGYPYYGGTKEKLVIKK